MACLRTVTPMHRRRTRNGLSSDVHFSDCVTLRRPAPHVALVTIERPEARNAVNAAVAQGIARAVDITEADVDTWVIVITGAGGKSFCAGADLKEVAAGRAMSLRTEQGGFAGFTHRVRDKPWIAAVEGFALGGGCEIALACDIIVAVGAFRIRTAGAEARTDRGGGRASIACLAFCRGKIALELIATGADLPASRAHDFGMVNRLAAAGQAVRAAIALAADSLCMRAGRGGESLKVARVAADYRRCHAQADDGQGYRNEIPRPPTNRKDRAHFSRNVYPTGPDDKGPTGTCGHDRGAQVTRALPTHGPRMAAANICPGLARRMLGASEDAVRRIPEVVVSHPARWWLYRAALAGGVGRRRVFLRRADRALRGTCPRRCTASRRLFHFTPPHARDLARVGNRRAAHALSARDPDGR